MTTLALELAPPRSRVAARVAFHVACAIVGAALLSVLAQVSVPLPFTPVPITGQTLGVLLVGAAYGPALGASTIVVYLAWAVVGLPVLAPNADGSHDAGFAVLGAAAFTGGYLWGFLAASTIAGWLARRGWDRTFASAIGAMVLAEVVLYAIGLPWLSRALALAGLPSSLEATFAAGLYPYIVGDVLKLLAAAAMLPGAWWAVERFRPRED
ncbi:MAG TPA: biotin transporter BioY [Actinomycetota bacterium]|nr:biotin transporter BioY [Actinomycetota bacterium]